MDCIRNFKVIFLSCDMLAHLYTSVPKLQLFAFIDLRMYEFYFHIYIYIGAGQLNKVGIT